MLKSVTLLILLTLGVLVAASDVFAQSSANATSSLGSSRGKVGGYTGNELRSIYREDVGQGYTSQSLSSLSLQSARARVGYVGQSSAGMPTGGTSSLTSGSVSSLAPSRSPKPFSSVSSSPAVSPYMNLFREDFDGGGDFNYQTLVRPQLQQQQFNQQFQRQNMELAARVQSISAQSAYQNPAGSESVYPTGHQTGFGTYMHYYPSLGQQRRGR